MAVTIKFKRGQSQVWTDLNLLLAPGEPGFELDTGKLKIGDGKTFWNDLPYINEDSESGKIINAKTHYDFPSVGDVNNIYKAFSEKKIYQWNSDKLMYEEISEAQGSSIDIDIINGGSANV